MRTSVGPDRLTLLSKPSRPQTNKARTQTRRAAGQAIQVFRAAHSE